MTTTAWDSDPFAVRPSTPAVSFKDAPIGTIREGTVISVDTDVQGRNFKTGEADTWPSGDPRLSIVITLETSDGPQALWITKWHKDAKFKAVAAAQQTLGRVLQPGDLLRMKYTGNDPDNTDRKLYRAKITAGAVDHFAKGQEEPPF